MCDISTPLTGEGFYGFDVFSKFGSEKIKNTANLKLRATSHIMNWQFTNIIVSITIFFVYVMDTTMIRMSYYYFHVNIHIV